MLLSEIGADVILGATVPIVSFQWPHLLMINAARSVDKIWFRYFLDPTMR